MALTYGFYNSVEGDRKYDAIQMGQIFDGIITDGVYATFLKAMVVKASENASEVIVQPGRCWFNHTWTYIDADYPVEAPAPEVILDRVDALVLDINSENAFRANSLVWVQGTPSSLNPERPALIKSVTHNQYPLCYVYRKAGTTMIYAADITNAVGTSETPFVTGVLEGINIDDLLAQWDDEFHTWEAATKTSFEAWMVNQQSVYVTWFDSIKDQMEDDLAGFEAWFETIRGIIDEEAATHLQAEIDDILDMLPAGSHIDVSTSESTLFNRNVTVSDGVHSKTVQFDASGAATVESFPYIGIISVTSTDGTRTAEESINIPYFGRYSAVLAFWSATVNLVGDESLAALPVTVRDSNGDVVSVVTLNASGQGVFTATKPDTYKFIYTYGGQTMEVSLAVTQETTYEVEIHGGLDYQDWLEAGRVSKAFESLDDILEDEKTLRQLFLVHDSVDYICDSYSLGLEADLTKIFNTDLAAKWVNNSDYALDHFYSVAGIKSIMDTADKYGYGEWCLMPQVPKMTSNTAPFGEASASGSWGGDTTNFGAWRAFSKSDSDSWLSAHNTYGWIQYKFVNPICVRKIKLYCGTAETEGVFAGKVQASNDGTNFLDIAQFDSTTNATLEVIFNNNSSYLYYRITPTSYNYTNNYRACRVYELEFYAWAPKGNVPIMTSNTAPYGTVSASTSYTASGQAPWKAFNPTLTGTHDGWASNTTGASATGWLQYEFVTPIYVKRFIIGPRTEAGYADSFPKKVKLQGSNDGTNFVDITEEYQTAQPSVYGFNAQSFDATPTNAYKYIRVYCNSIWNTDRICINTLQFYGRELKVSVPTMTSNTAPFGEAIGNTTGNYYLFDNTLSTSGGISGVASESNLYLAGYNFGKNVLLKMVSTLGRVDASDRYTASIKDFTIQGSNNGTTWEDLYTGVNQKPTSGSFPPTFHFIDTSNVYSYFRLKGYSNYGLSANSGLCELRFYGLDYSEKEFEAGTTKKWLYDHGVELETFEMRIGNQSGNGYVKEDNQIYFKTGTVNSNTGTFAMVMAHVDLAPYSLERLKIGDKQYVSTGVTCLDIGSSDALFPNGGTQNASYRVAAMNLVDGSSILPNNIALDISSINDDYLFFGVQYLASRYATLAEWWLE